MILPQVSIFNFFNFILTQKWRLKAQSGKKLNHRSLLPFTRINFKQQIIKRLVMEKRLK